MPKKYVVRLHSDEKLFLQEIVSKGKTNACRIRHANLLLSVCVNGANLSDNEAAKLFSCHCRTVENLRQRFVEEGLESALDRRKRECPPRNRLLDGEGEAQLIALACSQRPEGRSHWTLHLLADKLIELQLVETISHETVRQTLKKTN